MIEHATGNLLLADAQALVNTVNCVGVMGKGIALQFKQAYPAMAKAYEKACARGEVQPGQMHVWDVGQLNGPRYVINFPTKRHWIGKSRYADIAAGLPALVEVVRTHDIRSIALPPLGCGNGGLAWSRVLPMIEEAFAALPDVRVLIYGPKGEPAAEDRVIRTQRPSMTHARALFIAAMDRYAVLAYETTQLEIQKLAYFLQANGEPLNFQFSPQRYGPYADNLNKVLEAMAGHQLDGYTGDRSPAQVITLRPGAVDEAKAFLDGRTELRQRIDRLERLIRGFETPYGLELLSSVHWVAHHAPHQVTNPPSATRAIHAWNERKRSTMSETHVSIAWERLRHECWLRQEAGQ